jgi:hypothetical protein
MLLVLLGAGSSALAATLVWTNVANGYWNDPAAWVEAVVPTANDDVLLYDASSLYITNAAYAKSVTMENPSGFQYLTLYNGGGYTASLVIGGGTGALQRSPTGGATPNANVQAWAATDLGTDGLIHAGSLEAYTVTWQDGRGPCYVTTDFNIYSQVEMAIGDSSPANNVYYHQAGGNVMCGNTGYGIALGVVSSYGTGVTNTAAYYLDGGALQANRIGAGDGNGDNFNVGRWICGTPVIYFNNGTIQPYQANSPLYIENLKGFHYCTNPPTLSGAIPPDMQLATWNPTTIVLAPTGTHTFSTATATGGTYADIYITPSTQIVDSPNGPGSLVKAGASGNLVFQGDNPAYATNRFSGTTTVSGGLLQTRFDQFAGQLASSTGTNVLLDGFSPHSRVILNGGNYQLIGRANGFATNYTGVSWGGGAQYWDFGADVGKNLAVGALLLNPNLPAGAYLRRNISARYVECSHYITNSGSFTDQTLQIAGASFICTQHLAAVTLQQNGVLTVTANGSSGTTLVCGPIDGPGALTFTGGARLQLTGVNTYSGATSNLYGTVVLGPNSWPSNSPAIYLYNYQNLNGTAIPGGVVVGANQALVGAGAISGAVTINGVFAPGNPSVPFYVDEGVTLAGTTLMALNKNVAGMNTALNTGTLNYGGTLVVTNLGATSDLVPGDSFKLFGAAVYNNDFVTSFLPPLMPGLSWVWTPATGTLSVGGQYAPDLTCSVSANTLHLAWPDLYAGWYIQSNSVGLMATNQWYSIPGSQNATSLSIPIPPTSRQIFYRMIEP